MSIIGKLLAKAMGAAALESRVLMVGLDASGRTTVLYQWKLGSVVTTIPTIGFNVETIEYNHEKLGRFALTCWDVGGCDKIRPLWRHYFQNTQLVMMFFDSNDRDRFPEAVEELNRMISEEELRNAPILLVFNKQDLPNAMAPSEMMKEIGVDELRRRGKVVRGRGVCATSGSGLQELLRDAVELVAEAKSSSGGSGGGSGGGGSAGGDEKKEEKPSLLEEWLEREDEDDEIFLKKFYNYDLDSWDHYTHLRIAWLIFQQEEDSRMARKKITEGIRNFISNSNRTSGKTFHMTLTYFWIQLVHFAIIQMPKPLSHNFKTFLVMNPQLSNGGLFLSYYTKAHMMNNPAARNEVVLPNLRPLPSLLADTTSDAATAKATATAAAAAAHVSSEGGPADDRDFLKQFADKTLLGWSHLHRVRLAFLCLRGKKVPTTVTTTTTTTTTT
eukprot:CAMPEP_0198309350 /NCGR_PEP_ID=MMETSP1450-20131203/1745_1 /TAXON_ID=753684 ORGANISM="Madagascaria erythrocladiodes, Strain CCMP3234" /NCGR_SAMPLE_ID=MMETSP1450 /ASSEMBLY_ACC=CAM_ASM_001115 /LENGTH=442 /DNA_ID=CAMNT_0044012103 /DNA_START=129 /DNA_END=1454 /DNA_ORIENTATION=-